MDRAADLTRMVADSLHNYLTLIAITISGSPYSPTFSSQNSHPPRVDGRQLYLVDADGNVVRRWPVSRWTEDQILDLERKIKAIICSDSRLHDSAFDRC